MSISAVVKQKAVICFGFLFLEEVKLLVLTKGDSLRSNYYSRFSAITMNSCDPTNGIGYVYLKTHLNAQGLHKIGLTRRPAVREEQLGGDDCIVVARVMALNPEVLEKELHAEFDYCRVPQSEWFNLDDAALKVVIEVLSQAQLEATVYVVLPDSKQRQESSRYQQRKDLQMVNGGLTTPRCFDSSNQGDLSKGVPDYRWDSDQNAFVAVPGTEK